MQYKLVVMIKSYFRVVYCLSFDTVTVLVHDILSACMAV